MPPALIMFFLVHASQDLGFAKALGVDGVVDKLLDLAMWAETQGTAVNRSLVEAVRQAAPGLLP